MKNVLTISIMILALAFAGSAMAGNGKKNVEVCKVAGGTQSRVVVSKHELKGFFARYPGSYFGDCKTPEPTPTPVPVFVSQVDRDGYCTAQPVLRNDGTVGRFVDLSQGDVNLTGLNVTYKGQTITPAFFLQGAGESCEVPAGYHAAGYSVSGSDGTVDVAGPEFNIHPLYVK